MRAAAACAAWTGQAEVAPALRPIDAEGLMAWAIGRERADLICEHLMRERPEAFGGGSCLVAVERYCRLGTFVDCSGQAQVEAAHCHPDAEAAYMAAAAVLGAGELRLVRSFAQADSRPSWRPFHVVTAWPELVFKDGKWKPRVRRPGGGPAYCPVVWHDRGAELAAWRENYLDWHRALAHLEPALDGLTFKKWRLVPLRAPERPWE